MATLDPVHYPADFDRVAAIVDAERWGARDAALALVPRLHVGQRPGLLGPGDPLVRHRRGDSDDLQVGTTLVRGEGPAGSASAGRCARSRWPRRSGPRGSPGRSCTSTTRTPGSLDLRGLDRAYAGPDLVLYGVPDVQAPPAGRVRSHAGATLAADALALGLVGAGLGLAVRGRRRQHRRHVVLRSESREGESVILIAKFMIPVLAGGLAAGMAMYGVVWSQTKAPGLATRRASRSSSTATS